MRSAALGLCSVALSLMAAAPKPTLASSSAPARRGPAPAPAWRALTGGLVALRAPASTMVLVPRSTFVMGSTPLDVIDAAIECGPGAFGERCKDTAFANEMPQRRVTLSAFWLDRTEVTVADYQHCVQLGRCRPVPFEDGARRYARPELPMSMVTWDDARTYCEARGARLPTEAEFERAARGVGARRYPWGNLYNSHAANHGRIGIANTDDGDGFEEAAPVGSFPSGRTAEGFLDLAGNVAEWVHDRYFPSYPPGEATDPRGPDASAAGSTRVVRGGHYQTAAPWLRGAARVPADPQIRRPYVGFRCARSAAAEVPTRGAPEG